MPQAQENSYDPGYFSNGNPATGELATMMTAEWCNGVQEELLAVIQDAQLTPSDSDLSQLLQALKHLFSTSDAEVFRKSMIGCLVPMAVSTLPAGFGNPDGSLFLFEDYPELEEKYNAGGFNGMLLEANASAEDKAAWVGKWVKHSEGIGLYAPRLQGLFLRNAGTQGQFNAPGLPQMSGELFDVYGGEQMSIKTPTGVFENSNAYTVGSKGASSGTTLSGMNVRLYASLASPCYGASDTVMPESADMTVGLYLGRTA